VTGQHGKIILRLDDKDANIAFAEKGEDDALDATSAAREVTAIITMQDEATTSSAWDMRLHGVHWPLQGVVLLTTTSEKFAGIFGLPHLAPNKNFFRSSQRLLNQTLDKVLTRKEKTKFTDPSIPWSSTADSQAEQWNFSPHCEYVVYAQVHPLDAHRLRGNAVRGKARESLGDLVQTIEDELRRPTGVPINGIPELRISTVMWSPDCSFFLESKGPPIFPSVEGEHLVGMKEEVFLYQAKIWLLAFAAVVFGQVYLLKGQVRESSTPSTIGRVSFYTVSIMLLADGLIFAAALAWSLSASTTLLPSLILALSTFMSMTIGGAFLSEIYKIQEPERRNRDQPSSSTTPARPTPAAAAASAAMARAGTVPELPRPVTARPARSTPTPPIIIPSDQDIDTEIAENTALGAAAVPTAGTTRPAPAPTTTTPPAANTGGTLAQQIRTTTFSSITGRFIFLGTAILFLSLAATSWPAPIRAAYANILAFLYLSLWVPQIWRNARRNSRRASSWRFTAGQSFLRALPLAYFYLREDNVFFAQPDPTSFAMLVTWLWVQLWILGFQDVLGPRFGVPRGWMPDAWDYHPVLREDNIEGGGLLPLGLSSASAETSPVLDRARSLSLSRGGAESRKREKTRDKKDSTLVRSVDCAICREVLEVPVVPRGADPDAALSTAGGVAGMLARRMYMVTPCRHIFHSACLEGWLRFRLQCPICREELPPL
jgi:hypothetical protein